MMEKPLILENIMYLSQALKTQKLTKQLTDLKEIIIQKKLLLTFLGI